MFFSEQLAIPRTVKGWMELAKVMQQMAKVGDVASARIDSVIAR